MLNKISKQKVSSIRTQTSPGKETNNHRTAQPTSYPRNTVTSPYQSTDEGDTQSDGDTV